MKKRRTRTASAAELKKLKPKKKFNVHNETKKLLNTFLPFPNEDPIHFMSPDEVVAVDFGGIIKRTTAGKIAEAVANHRKPGILGRLDPEKVLTDDVKAKIKSSFDNILNTPSKEPTDLPNYEQPTSYSFELKPTDVFKITIEGQTHEFTGEELQYRCKLKKELQELLAWKANATKATNDLREYTAEEIVTQFLEQLQGHESQYPWIIETVNSRLIGHLQKIAETTRETSDIARKRFEEAVLILQSSSTPPKKY